MVCQGIALLTFALFTSARMGIMQEVLYGKYGKHPREALFFTVSHFIISLISFIIVKRLFLIQHALPLPGFILLFSDIANHVHIANSSQPLDWSFIPLLAAVPRIWIYLLGNVITQSVY